MARQGLPKKYAKMGFKKGWREFKKARANRGRVSGTAKKVTTAKRSTVGRPKSPTTRNTTKTVVVRVPSAPRHLSGQAKLPAKKKTGTVSGKRGGFPMPKVSVNRLMNDLFAVFAAVAGASGSGFMLNATPAIKDFPTWGKIAAQFGIGWFMRESFSRRYPLVKELGFGAMVAAGISATQELTKLNALAGRSPRRLSDAEFKALISGGVNGPVNSMGYNGVSMGYNGVRMGGPVNSMGAGAYPNSMMGTFRT